MQGLDLPFRWTASDKQTITTSSSPKNSSWSKTVNNNLMNLNNNELLSISQCVLNAQIYCLLKVAEGHFSYRSCTDISNLFKIIFGEGNKIA